MASSSLNKDRDLSTVLIVSANYDDRRTLFEALERGGKQVARMVLDTEAARLALAEGPDTVAVFCDAGYRKDDLAAFCQEVLDKHKLPVIGILPAEQDTKTSSWDCGALPVGFADCLQSPVLPGEAMYRLQRVLNKPGAVSEFDSENNSVFAPLLKHVNDGLVILDADSLVIRDVNPAFEKLTRQSRQALVGKALLEMDMTHDDVQRAELSKRLESDGQVRVSCRMARGDDSWYPANIVIRMGTFLRQPGYLATIRALSVQHYTQRALDLIAESFDVRMERKYLNRLAAHAVTWLGADYFLVATRERKGRGLEVQALFCRRDIKDDLEAGLREGFLRRILQGEVITIREGAWQDEQCNDRFVLENSIESYMGLALVDATKEVNGVLIIASRKPLAQWKLVCATMKIIANRFAMELQARQFYEDTRTQGLRDNLTRLPNRLLFEDRLESALAESQRTGEMFAVLFVDLDRFKTINDTFGHDVGDQVLREVAKRLSSSIRASDTVARYAGDEFVLVMRHVTQRKDVARIANKLNQILADPLTLGDGKEITCTASIGVSFYPDDGVSGDDLIKHADQAMYKAKALGRNTTQLYVNFQEESPRQKLLLEAKLGQARQNDELRVFYQPQVDTESEDVVGMEALIRWQHPELGLISPGFFIPLAEETGLIIDIGDWILAEACRQTRAWNKKFGLKLRVSVNLSAVQLKQAKIADGISRHLRESGLSPQYLELEITESISINEVPDLMGKLRRLHNMGCSIAIDDFGTGQSSLDYIRRLPADRIKIDQSFVRNIGVDPDDAAIVDATIVMAHNLKRHVVAEGVEEEAQLEFLQKRNCEEAQGYLFSRPLPAAVFERLLTERQKLMGEQASA